MLSGWTLCLYNSFLTLHDTAKKIKCMPVKTISVRQCDKPWITEEIKQMIRNKISSTKKLKYLIPTSRGKALDKLGTTSPTP